MPDTIHLLLFIPLLFVIAALYSSVGHGGASGYLALMAIFSFSPSVMKSSALILNVFVSLISFYQYAKGGYFSWKLFLPFIITSVPAAFLGALITLDAVVYKRILGLILIFPVLRLAGVFGKESNMIREIPWVPGLAAGMMIGLLSGMIGIGGGILLSPLILLMRWGTIKQAAAVSALFIFVNSLAGLAGLFWKGASFDPNLTLWIAIVFSGGLAGAYFGRVRLSNRALKTVLSLVLLIASIKLLSV